MAIKAVESCFVVFLLTCAEGYIGAVVCWRTQLDEVKRQRKQEMK